MHHERRRHERHPVNFYVQQFAPGGSAEGSQRLFATDLSASGLYVERPRNSIARDPSLLQLEIPLPDSGDAIWAAGEIVFEREDQLFHGSGVRFIAISPTDARRLREWLQERARTERLIPHPDRSVRAAET